MKLLLRLIRSILRRFSRFYITYIIPAIHLMRMIVDGLSSESAEDFVASTPDHWDDKMRGKVIKILAKAIHYMKLPLSCYYQVVPVQVTASDADYKLTQKLLRLLKDPKEALHIEEHVNRKLTAVADKYGGTRSVPLEKKKGR